MKPFSYVGTCLLSISFSLAISEARAQDLRNQYRDASSCTYAKAQYLTETGDAGYCIVNGSAVKVGKNGVSYGAHKLNVQKKEYEGFFGGNNVYWIEQWVEEDGKLIRYGCRNLDGTDKCTGTPGKTVFGYKRSSIPSDVNGLSKSSTPSNASTNKVGSSVGSSPVNSSEVTSSPKERPPSAPNYSSQINQILRSVNESMKVMQNLGQ